jgi:hypothetical protein
MSCQRRVPFEDIVRPIEIVNGLPAILLTFNVFRVRLQYQSAKVVSSGREVE